jgi:hypothetical protein
MGNSVTEIKRQKPLLTPKFPCHSALLCPDDIAVDRRSGELGVTEPFLEQRNGDAAPKPWRRPFAVACARGQARRSDIDCTSRTWSIWRGEAKGIVVSLCRLSRDQLFQALISPPGATRQSPIQALSGAKLGRPSGRGILGSTDSMSPSQLPSGGSPRRRSDPARSAHRPGATS